MLDRTCTEAAGSNGSELEIRRDNTMLKGQGGWLTR